MKVLLVGETDRTDAFRLRLANQPQVEIEVSDGDSDEDDDRIAEPGDHLGGGDIVEVHVHGRQVAWIVADGFARGAVAELAGVVIAPTADLAAVEEAICGPNGILAAGRKGVTIVDLSTLPISRLARLWWICSAMVLFPEPIVPKENRSIIRESCCRPPPRPNRAATAGPAGRRGSRSSPP